MPPIASPSDSENGKLSRQIRRARGFADLKQHELAAKLGVSPQLVSGWENGERQPRTRELIGIADITGFTVDWLLGREEDAA